MNSLKAIYPLFPGRLYSCKVLRKEQDKDYYLVAIVDPTTDNEKAYAFIHKNHVVKPLKLGDLIMATFTGSILAKYPVLSQKIPQHIINIVDLFLGEEISFLNSVFDRAAATRKSKYCKIGVWGDAGFMSFTELNQILLKSNKSKILTEYIPQPIFIPGGSLEVPKHFTEFPVQFMINALYPAPVEKILDYEFREKKRAIYIILKIADFPLFLWKDYINVKLAAKLTKTSYHLVASDTGQEVIVDPYKVEDFFTYGLSSLKNPTNNVDFTHLK